MKWEGNDVWARLRIVGRSVGRSETGASAKAMMITGDAAAPNRDVQPCLDDLQWLHVKSPSGMD